MTTLKDYLPWRYGKSTRFTIFFALGMTVTVLLLVAFHNDTTAHATSELSSSGDIGTSPAINFGGFSNATDPRTAFYNMPYHPRNYTAYWAEKQKLDSISSVTVHKIRSMMSMFNAAIVNTNSGFDGLDVTAGGGNDPPDVAMALNSSSIVELVNVKGEMWNKQGTSQQNLTLSSFFGLSGSDKLQNPKILYDDQSSRWFATILDTNNATVSIVVSKTSALTSSPYKIHDKFSTGCPDQPRLGISDDKVVVAENIFDCSNRGFLRSDYHVYDKTNLMSGTKTFQNFSNNDFGIQPVQSQSSASTLYMVSDGGTANTKITLYSITGTVPHASSSSQQITINQLHLAASAVQPITTTVLDTGDERPLDAAWYGGKLWLATNDGCTPTGDSTTRSCVRLIELNTNSSKKIQDFDLNATGNYYYYPALRFDGYGGMGVVFGVSSSDSDNNIYPSLIVDAQAASDPLNSVEQLTYLKTGSEYEDATLSSLTPYGEYFGAAFDSTNKSKIWVAGEYNKNPPGHPGITWSTFIGSMSFECMPPASGDWTILTSCTLAGNATAPANVILQNNSILTVPNKQTLAINFTGYHLLVNYGSQVYVVPGGKIS
jgi:hypothetical protein